MFEATALKHLLASANKKYIYGTFPLVNLIVLILEMAIIAQIVRRYDSYFDSRPVLTMMITNSVLNGIADTVAQTVTSIRERAVRKPGGVRDDDTMAIEIHELDLKNPLPKFRQLVPDSRSLPPPFDFERLGRFMAWGFLIAPFQFKWFQFLSKGFPIGKTNGTTQSLKRVAFDQLGFAPVGLGAFFTYMTLAEGGNMKDVHNKFDNVYFPALKANYILWPAVQMLNFRIVPLQFQLPFASTVGIAWGTYLSLTNSSSPTPPSSSIEEF